ncbi:MAG: thiamine diphosphokinase [Ruminococcus sp.]|nr:thiamine diphosphokinase [Ruminococcus sp.]
MKKCVIFTGGQIDDDFSFIDIDDIKDTYIICADSGCIYAEKLGIKPDLIIGDYDSLGFIPENGIIFPVEKDDTDLMLAIKEGISSGYKCFDIYGAFGGRLDHLLGNIQSLGYIVEQECNGKLISQNEQVEILPKGQYEMLRKNGYSLSLFSYSDKVTGLTIAGTMYTAENIEMDSSFPIGISNKITSDKAYISFESGRLLVIQSKLF